MYAHMSIAGPESTLDIQSKLVPELLGTLGNSWELLGTLGNSWELLGAWESIKSASPKVPFPVQRGMVIERGLALHKMIRNKPRGRCPALGIRRLGVLE